MCTVLQCSRQRSITDMQTEIDPVMTSTSEFNGQLFQLVDRMPYTCAISSVKRGFITQSVDDILGLHNILPIICGEDFMQNLTCTNCSICASQRKFGSAPNSSPTATVYYTLPPPDHKKASPSAHNSKKSARHRDSPKPSKTLQHEESWHITMSNQETVLYSYWRSSCSWRVRIALNIKQIPYTYLPISLIKEGGEQFDPTFLKLNPSAQVPVLEIDGHRLTESIAILEYLEETRPNNPLLPSAPSEKAQVRMLVEIINSGTQPKQNLAVLKYVAELGGEEARKKFAAHWIEKGLNAFEKELELTAGTCCVGNNVTFADLVVVPQAYNSARLGIDIKKFPRIAKIVNYLEQLPEFKEAHPSKQPDAS